MKLSEDQNQVSGITLTAVGNKVLAVWRRKGDGNDVDSIMYSVISNGGKKATKGEVLADVCAFDQPTLIGDETDLDVVKNVVTFRTNDFPWTANDGVNAFVFYSDRGRDPVTKACLADGKPRIVMHHSNLSGQVNWTAQRPIDQTATDETFQFMPTAFGANGKVQVAWYDTRRDPTNHPLDLPFVADYDFLYPGYVGSLVNRTVDVFTMSLVKKTEVERNTRQKPHSRTRNFSPKARHRSSAITSQLPPVNIAEIVRTRPGKVTHQRLMAPTKTSSSPGPTIVMYAARSRGLKKRCRTLLTSKVQRPQRLKQAPSTRQNSWLRTHYRMSALRAIPRKQPKELMAVIPV